LKKNEKKCEISARAVVCKTKNGFFERFRRVLRTLQVFDQVDHVKLNVDVQGILVGDFLHVGSLAKGFGQVLDSVNRKALSANRAQNFSHVVADKGVYVLGKV